VAGPAVKGLLAHTHSCIAVTILGAQLLLHELSGRHVVRSCDQLFVALAAKLASLDSVVVRLSQILGLLCLHLCAVSRARLGPLLVTGAHVHRSVDCGRVLRHIERVEEVVEHFSVLHALFLACASAHARRHLVLVFVACVFLPVSI